MSLLLIALGTYKLLDIAKEASAVYGPWRPWFKGLVSIAIAGGLSLLVTLDPREVALLGLGAAGLSAILHEVHSWVYLAADEKLQNVISRTRSRRVA